MEVMTAKMKMMIGILAIVTVIRKKKKKKKKEEEEEEEEEEEAEEGQGLDLDQEEDLDHDQEEGRRDFVFEVNFSQSVTKGIFVNPLSTARPVLLVFLSTALLKLKRKFLPFFLCLRRPPTSFVSSHKTELKPHLCFVLFW